ncbi:MAG: type II toxin-antitoxin system RelE/ParE family toxin [Wenzhouxiangella sp.]|nr:type II toxin-antitoxin system RelE/ParE family toxin [Wenzhouxiangella sp.]
MSLSVQLIAEAEADLEEAAAWYEKQQSGLGRSFLDEALVAFRSIADNPKLYPVVHKKVRRRLMRRFPFGIFYLQENDSLVVLAVMHGSRHPRRWQSRAD